MSPGGGRMSWDRQGSNLPCTSAEVQPTPYIRRGSSCSACSPPPPPAPTPALTATHKVLATPAVLATGGAASAHNRAPAPHQHPHPYLQVCRDALFAKHELRDVDEPRERLRHRIRAEMTAAQCWACLSGRCAAQRAVQDVARRNVSRPSCVPCDVLVHLRRWA
eukprot:220960-Chlamydomonas_euryale.AAC.1